MIFAKDEIKTVNVFSAIFDLKNTIPPKHNTPLTVYSSSSTDFTVNILPSWDLRKMSHNAQFLYGGTLITAQFLKYR